MLLKDLLTTVFVALVLLPLLCTLSLLSFTVQRFVIVIAKNFRSDLSHIYADYGIFFALERIYKRPKVNILACFICDGQLELDVLRRQFDQRIINFCDQSGNLKYRTLRQTWTQFLGYMFWKWDRDFDLSNHVRLYDYNKDPELALSSPCTEADLKRVMGSLISKPYVEGRSPWELLLIPEYSYTDENGKIRIGSVLSLKIHHGMADGFSILKLLDQLFDSRLEHLTAKFPPLPPLRRFLQTAVEIVKFPYDVAQNFLQSNDPPSSWHIVDRKLTRQYFVLGSDRIPTGTIKAIKNKYGVSYNAVVYSIAAGGVSRLLKGVGMEFPKRVGTLVPYPLPNHPGGLANHASFTMVGFSPVIQSPGVRLREIASQIKEPRTLPTLPNSNIWLGALLMTLPIPFLRSLPPLNYSMSMTSFACPDKPWDVSPGVRIVDVVLGGGMGRGTAGSIAHCPSLAGYQRIFLLVDRLILEGYQGMITLLKNVIK